MIDNKKISYCNDSFNDNAGDSKALYTLVRKLTNKQTAVTYPESQSNEELSETFCLFQRKNRENKQLARKQSEHIATADRTASQSFCV